MTSPLDLSDVDPALLGAPWEISPPAFPAPTGGRSLQISPAVQRLLQKDTTLQALFESVGWPIAAPRPLPALSDGSAFAAAPALPATAPSAIPLVVGEAQLNAGSLSAGSAAEASKPITAADAAPQTIGAPISAPVAPAVFSSALSLNSMSQTPPPPVFVEQLVPTVAPSAAPPPEAAVQTDGPSPHSSTEELAVVVAPATTTSAQLAPPALP